MKINVDDYVRTKKGSIGKVLGIDYLIEGNGNSQDNIEGIYFDNVMDGINKDIFTCCLYIFKECKSSLNIIDLVEVGDVIKYKIYTPLETKGYLIGITDISDNEMLERIKEDENYHILEIITHEQIERTSYKIGEE